MLSRKTIVGQFRRPHGMLGALAGTIMACRPSNRQRNLWTVSLLDLQADDQVLEIGCGPGVALRQVALEVPQGSVTAVDHSPLMVKMARTKLAGQKQAHVEVGGVAALRAFDQSLTAIYSANVIQFLPDPAELFALARRALAPHGRIATTYQPRGSNAKSEDACDLANAVEESMRAAGFTNVRTATLPLRPVAAVSVVGYVV